VTVRLERSELSVPATNRRMIEKALASDADVAMIDLEDSVPPDAKEASRENVIRAFREVDWGSKPPAFRVNGLETPFFYRDIIEIVEAAGDRLALIVVPKVHRPEDVVVVDTLLSQIEMRMGFPPGKIGLEAQIESAAGLVNCERIATASPRLESLIFGPGDFSSSVRMPMENIGVMGWWDEQYPGHRYHYAMSRMVVAARAAGLRAVDGPVANFKDLEAVRQSCIVARGLGFDGKWCIHPAQVPIANEVFAPTKQEIEWAQKVVDAYREAMAGGQGVISLNGVMVDEASIKLAQATLDLAERAKT
jgi:citrate lyase beta subunit